MNSDYAHHIASWQYPPPYELYSMDGSQETIQELLEGNYYVALKDEAIYGYFCYGAGARVPGGYDAGIYDDKSLVDIGLGLHPNNTGKGLGMPFLLEMMHFLKTQLNPCAFQLVVATFNERAINVYKKVGFQPQQTFMSPVNGKPIEFLYMVCNV
ncbi:GNAT family N-acetyltransferase [Bacillus alkalicola]|uniref:GNAT family N-acetyltransferase n=2 Tax=Bacillales TaxID=1385 RepID=A0ABS6JW68_9BACI|nr:GNAT family N-acetyltransferase [Bacillus alkalicola]